MTNGLSNTPFRHLVSGCLSTVTLTKRVVNACVPLYKKVSSFRELAAIDAEELRALIKPVAHYNRKTVLLKSMARKISDEHGGQIPRTKPELLKLPGVGQKVADLTMTYLHGKPTVAVDTHIYRLGIRLGVITCKNRDKAGTELTALTYQRHKAHAHEWLIQHGLKVCRTTKPGCGTCLINDLCPRYGVKC